MSGVSSGSRTTAPRTDMDMIRGGLVFGVDRSKVGEAIEACRRVQDRLDAGVAAEEALRVKPDQPLLNAARRLVKATDNAERNAALGDLYNAMKDER